MSRTVKTNILLFIFTGLLTVGIFNCGEDTVVTPPNTPEAKTISGTITFVDTNNVSSGGFYYVAAYASWPPLGSPTSGDTLVPVKNGNVYSAEYKIIGLPDTGTFVITNAWLKVPYTPGSGIYGLGFYGCDPPSPLCAISPATVRLESGVGLANINFKSKLDTLNPLYKF